MGQGDIDAGGYVEINCTSETPATALDGILRQSQNNRDSAAEAVARASQLLGCLRGPVPESTTDSAGVAKDEGKLQLINAKLPSTSGGFTIS